MKEELCSEWGEKLLDKCGVPVYREKKDEVWMGESRDLREYGDELHGTQLWGGSEKREVILRKQSGSAHWANEVFGDWTLNGGEGSYVCGNEWVYLGAQTLKHIMFLMQVVWNGAYKRLVLMKTKPRHFALICPRRGIAGVCNLVFCYHGISFQVTKCQLGI